MIDLRSDTVTRPSEEMRAAIASAQVGDDVYADDPTVNALEERVADMFGKEAGVFTPTGSLSNQLGIRTLVRPGEELLTETFSHIVRAELGAGAAFSGITTRTWEGDHGLLVAQEAMAIARPDSGPYLVSTKAIAVENTHNFGGGTVQPIDEIRALRKLTSSVGIAMHLDGARIWNAHIATGISFKDYGDNFDTVSVCFSKGLGAPIGSMLLSTKERASEARVWRKRYGAGMRQVGLLAAGANFALDNNLPTLAQDHRRAREIAIACSLAEPTSVDLDYVHTNIVVLNLVGSSESAQQIAASLKDAGILSSALGPTTLRLVTHRDLADADISKTNSVLPDLLERAFKS